MSNHSVVYGCCVGWWDEFAAYVLPWVGAETVYSPHVPANTAAPEREPARPLITVSGATSIAKAYNTIIDAAYEYRPDALILLHTDLEITDPEAEQKILAGFATWHSTAMIGVAGGDRDSGTAWWECNPIGHQMTDAGMIDFASDVGGAWGSGPAVRTKPRARYGRVDVLEGSLLALSPWALRTLRFDEDMPGFHGYDEICLQALSFGRSNLVLDIDTHHHTKGGFKGRQSGEDWVQANRRSREKWDLT